MLGGESLEEFDEKINNLFKMISETETQSDREALARIISNRLGVSSEESYILIKNMRFIMENDYVMLDTLFEVINSIVNKLYVKGLLSEQDIEDIKKDNNNTNE